MEPEISNQAGPTTPSLSHEMLQKMLDRLPDIGSKGAYTRQYLRNKLQEHKEWINVHGEDMPEIRNWKWTIKM